MFKRYKLKPKVFKPLAVRSKRVEVAKRITDEFQRTILMLKNPSSTVRMRGAREIEKLESISVEMIKELMKMVNSDKKEARALFYRVTDKLLKKALPSELKQWEEYIFMYLATITTNTFIGARKDGLNLLGLAIKYYPRRTARIKDSLLSWLSNDEKILMLDPKHSEWTKEVIKKKATLQTLQPPQDPTAKHTDTIRLTYSYLCINNKEYHYYHKP
ncbi:hypothetical protein NEOKW01_0076 [Nematocida sp. AWRm80]|nr:hypothetical protein NEOKW01_0076 [Nematocida sp. AWRm80]